jgi:hypothetical protein
LREKLSLADRTRFSMRVTSRFEGDCAGSQFGVGNFALAKTPGKESRKAPAPQRTINVNGRQRERRIHAADDIQLAGGATSGGVSTANSR